jgi:4-hydroxybenzoate polyprenyltransferase
MSAGSHSSESAHGRETGGGGSTPPRWVLYARLVRLHRPIGTLLLIWPTLWALWCAARGVPPAYELIAFCLGTVLMRSAGCAINDWADRDFDRHVQRTRDRPLTAGLLRASEALWIFVGLSLLALLLVLPMNRLTWALAAVAAFLAGSYPFTKRFFALPQAYLGIAFGFGIPMAFAALQGQVPMVAWVMLVANIFWAIAYDTEYAMVDREDDLKIGIRTSAITFGRFDVLAVMLSYAAALGLLALAGVLSGAGLAWYAGLVVAAAIALYHWTLIRHRSREGCFRAFNHNTWFGAVVFGGIALDFALRSAR